MSNLVLTDKPEMLGLNEALTNSMTLWMRHPGKYIALNLGRAIHNEMLFVKKHFRG